jgi:hypothetical protein
VPPFSWRQGPADENGELTFDATYPASRCGTPAQALDLATCATTNVETVSTEVIARDSGH